MPTVPRQGLEEPVAGSASREIGPHVEINLPEPHRQVLEQIEAGPPSPSHVRSALLDDFFAAARLGEVVCCGEPDIRLGALGALPIPANGGTQ